MTTLNEAQNELKNALSEALSEFDPNGVVVITLYAFEQRLKKIHDLAIGIGARRAENNFLDTLHGVLTGKIDSLQVNTSGYSDEQQEKITEIFAKLVWKP